MWKVKIDGEDVVIDGDQQILCYLCEGEMIPGNVKKLKFNSVPYSGEFDCRAIDIDAVCVDCGMVETFGIAVSIEEYDKANIMGFVFP